MERTGRIWRRYHWAAANCPRNDNPKKSSATPLGKGFSRSLRGLPAIPHENPQPAGSFADPTYMYFPPVAKSISRITIDLTGCIPSARSQAAGWIETAIRVRSEECNYANWGLWIRLPCHGHLRLSRRFWHTRLLLSCRRHAHHGSGQRQYSFFRKKSSGSDSAERAFRTPGLFGGAGRSFAQSPGNFSGGRLRAGAGRTRASPGKCGGTIPGAVHRDAGPGGFDDKNRQDAEGKRAEEPAGVPADVFHQRLRGRRL